MKSVLPTTGSYRLAILFITFPSTSYSTQPGIFLHAAALIMEPLTLFVVILHHICWVIGGAFILGSGMRYLHHRHHPGQSPVSQPLFLGVLGLVLILLPFVTRQAMVKPSVLRSNKTFWSIR